MSFWGTVYFHDWQADPFASGAYSYVPAKLKDAREHLAAPVDETLFFAGETAEVDGHSATRTRRDWQWAAS
jgi:hypothetical protein